MKANKKFVEEREAVSAVIGVILMVAITVAIAATVYVYVSGITNTEGSQSESASVTVEGKSGYLKFTLTKAGINYPAIGYGTGDVDIYVGGQAITPTTEWLVGLPFYVGDTDDDAAPGNLPYTFDTSPPTGVELITGGPLDVDVSVSIKNTAVYSGTVTITG